MSELVNLPPQKLPYNRKNAKWRKQMLDWADSKTFFNYSLVRKSVIHKKINSDLLNGKLHMSDLEVIVNPENIKSSSSTERLQHFPIMNSKLNVLRGEESKRIFDYRVVVTNPNSLSEIEEEKKNALLQDLQKLIQEKAQSEDELKSGLEKLNEYYAYSWQDLKEIRANETLKHYVKEYDIPLLFNTGFTDAMAVGEEIYQCDIVGGEPVIERINPLKIRVFKSGYSNRIEDADIILLEDYWSPGRVIDTYYEVLTEKDIKYIENLPDHIGQAAVDSMDNIDERYGYVNNNMVGDELSSDGFYFNPFDLFSDSISNSLLPYDLAGNLRVLRLYWKSKRKIKEVKSYDPETGEEIYNFYTEDYKINKDLGEEEKIMYINEAWEGTKIGSDIYVNIRPRPIQYNRLTNPSKCHFGIIGTIYNLNDSRPYSMVDMMKPYNYYYDVIHDRLNKLIERNWGKLLKVDLAKVPKGWEVDKWFYYAKTMGLAVEDSFKEGNYGASTGKLAGGMNNASSGVVDAELGNSIQQYINLLEFIKLEMSEVVGITRQREGQVSNRETVGGVERATLQSSHITEWIFSLHDNLKKRVLECFLDTAKIAFKGKHKKFPYILSDNSIAIMDIEGDEFAESEDGLVVDNSQDAQRLSQTMDTLAQAALQNQALSFSTITRLYSSISIAEKQRLIETDERAMLERQNQAQQEQLQAQQQVAQMQLQQKQEELEQKEQSNIRDNETKLMIATIQANSKYKSEDGIEEPSPLEKETLLEKIREFDEKHKLDKERLEFDKQKAETDARLKEKQINKSNRNTTT